MGVFVGLVGAANQLTIFRAGFSTIACALVEMREMSRTPGTALIGALLRKLDAAQELNQAYFAFIHSFHCRTQSDNCHYATIV